MFLRTLNTLVLDPRVDQDRFLPSFQNFKGRAL